MRNGTKLAPWSLTFEAGHSTKLGPVTSLYDPAPYAAAMRLSISSGETSSL